MYYPQEVLDEVLSKTDIVDVVSAHVHLKKRGKSYVGLCPFHNEKTPSFHVTPEKNMYYCFGCGAAGSALTFLMKYNNSSFAEALRELADRAGVTLPAPDMSEEAKKRERRRQDLLAANKEAAVYYFRLLRSSRGARGMKYFQGRGLDAETMKAFGLGFADGSRSDLTAWLRKKGFSDELILESGLALHNERQGVHDRFWNRVMFPIQDRGGKVIGFGGRVLGNGEPKYLNSPDSPVFDKGRNLYALNLARRSRKDYLILCEGYMDVIAMHQAGFTEAVASLGTAFTPGQAALLKRYAGKVLLAYDSDGAGVRAALRNIGILRSGGLESAVIDLAPHKDPDEFIRAEGKEAFQERIEQAQNSFFFELKMLEKNYRMDDPASRTEFHREIAKKLCAFSDEIERDNYIAASAEKYFIKTESLRRQVAQYGRAFSGREQSRSSPLAGSRYGNGRYRGENSPPDRHNQKAFSDRTFEAALSAAEKELSEQERRGPEGELSASDTSQKAAGTPSPGSSWKAAGGSAPGGFQRAAGSPSPGGSQRAAGEAAPGVSRKAGKTLLERQAILLSWAADDPGVLEEVRKVLRPEDFSGDLFIRTARLLWKQGNASHGEKEPAADRPAAHPAASVICAFDTPRQQEAVARILNMPLNRPQSLPSKMSERDEEEKERDGDRVGDREKMLRELVCAVKEEAVRRMMEAPGGGGAPLQELLAAKKELLALRTRRFSV